MNVTERERGSLSTEVVLLVPMLMLMLMFVVLVGRVQSVSMLVRHAADVGARSGSLAHMEDASRRAFAYSTYEISRAQNVCKSSRVHAVTQRVNDETMIVATATCVVRMSGLSFLGLKGPTIQAVSMEVVDRFRSIQ